MDGNKDDALKCFRIGKEAVESGDRVRALKFLTKARRLDPSLPVDDLIASIESNSNSNPEGPSVRATTAKLADQQSVRHRATATASSSSTSAAAYTEEQITIVRQIKKKKDYYDILGVEKSCSVEDVRKAYRKLSLKVHPDKNQAPGAEEAFKLVSKAFQCLSNEENRKKYDLLGSDQPDYQPRAQSRAAHGYNGFYDSEFDADEIFRNFFFGGMQPARTQFQHFNFGPGMAARTTDHGSAGFHLRALIQLLPVILIILLQFLPSSEPIYSLSRSYSYEYKLTTGRGVNYYVKSAKFEQDYPVNSAERMKFEKQVEEDYSLILMQNCGLEIQRQRLGFIKETPHCDMWRKLQDSPV
ncbi:chaperone protein dnaJ 49-like [Mangifera indica]|uniref:chaperone protein dnaJ 49-like n=1 Tax=Mangifera indica TaxID=29780 RepID=UPI001CFB7F6E|nr:chaperone protein dnaJ 49-like [Mangifera indica]XP_044472262.1 chaperone protein dnaJ 49-like [Mangifera indica]